jgi:hypothetical protein
MDAFGGAGMEWPQLADGGQEDFVEYHLFSNQALQKQTAGTKLARSASSARDLMADFQLLM